MANSELKYKGYTGSIEVSMEDECLHGRLLFIDDIVTYEAETVSGLTTSFQAAVDRYVAFCERGGKKANKPYSGTFNVRIGAEMHRDAALRASSMGVKLNEFVTRAIASALAADNPLHIEHRHQHFVTLTLGSGNQDLVARIEDGEPIWAGGYSARIQ